MKEKDKKEKQLEEYAEVFSDIVNVLLFDGEEIIKPEDLLEKSPTSYYKGDDMLFSQERDVVKYWAINGIEYGLIGIENQSAQHPFMPVRTIGYDGADYRFQIKKYDDARAVFNREKKALIEAGDPKADNMVFTPPNLYPVVTLVLYFGDKKWTRPKTLFECFDIPEKLKPYMTDYKANVFELAFLEDETIAKFKSDFKFVVELLKQERLLKEKKIEKITLTEMELHHVRDTIELLYAMTNDKRFLEALDKIKEGGTKAMFEVFDFYEQRGEERGEQRGRAFEKKKRTDEISILYKKLRDAGRLDEFDKATEDSSYMDELIEEYKLG